MKFHVQHVQLMQHKWIAPTRPAAAKMPVMMMTATAADRQTSSGIS